MKKATNFNQYLTGIPTLIIFIPLFFSIHLPSVIAQRSSVEADDLTTKGYDLINAGDYNGALVYADEALAIDRAILLNL